MCESSQTISNETPTATQGLNSARIYGMGEGEISSPTLCMPRLKNEFPSTLDNTTTAVTMRVLSCRAFSREGMLSVVANRGGLVSRAGRGSGLPLFGDVTFSLGAQREILARFFREPAAVGRIQ